MTTETGGNVIRYGSRTFGEVKEDLIALIRQSYPEVLSDFTDSSVGAMLIDLNAGVANNLSINTDRVFQETQLQYAQKKQSILNIAKNMGLNIPAKRPSVTVIDFTVLVPVLGDAPDASYYPALNVGAQVVGGGKTFETKDVIDWNSTISSLGDANRSIIPNLNSNGVVVSYNVTKREVVYNGSTSIYKKIINTEDVISFFSVTLPDPDVIEIESVILLEGRNFSSNPSISDFSNPDYKFYEVDYLAQQKVFTENYAYSQSNDNTNDLKAGIWTNVSKKFIKEFNSNAYCELTFGSGDEDVDTFQTIFNEQGVTNREFLDNFLNNTALGQKLKANYTLFIKYRTGGGTASNVGSALLTQLGLYTLTCNGSRQDYRQNVIRSLTVNNPIPAIGGNDGLGIEQIRQLIKYNFSSQMRSVNLTDYLSRVYLMPGMFGSPFRANVSKVNNKVVISVLGIGSNGKLNNISNSLLKENIAEYMSQYRMINDFVEITDGKIFNLAFDIDVYVEDIGNNQIANNIITTIRNYMSILDHEMGEDVFLGDIQKELINVNGVLNVLEIKAYNKVGGNYSNNAISQEISDQTTGEINIVNNSVYSDEDSMFEIKYPEKDIRVYLRKRGDGSTSPITTTTTSTTTTTTSTSTTTTTTTTAAP